MSIIAKFRLQKAIKHTEALLEANKRSDDLLYAEMRNCEQHDDSITICAVMNPYADKSVWAKTHTDDGALRAQLKLERLNLEAKLADLRTQLDEPSDNTLVSIH
ncbi:MAG TPA: hypothetical protein VFM68_03835 [Candidatus Saccharimonadales bacterium]|nr:hypothetical protein [Candidatus Saccharimonadales bacterium]